MTTQFNSLVNPLAAVFVFVLLSAASIRAATFSANPTMDALVTTGPGGNLATNNYGGAGAVSLSAAGLEMGEQQSVLQVSLAGAASAFNTQFGEGNWSVESVSLRLTVGNANNAIFNSPAAGIFGISWMQNDSWQEGTGSPSAPGATGITFASLQTLFIGPNDENLGAFSYSGATTGSSTYALGLTPGFLADIVSGGDVSLRLFAGDSVVSGVFSSRNFGTIANRPLLTIVAVPEPGTIALGSLGLILVTVWRLRVCRQA